MKNGSNLNDQLEDMSCTQLISILLYLWFGSQSDGNSYWGMFYLVVATYTMNYVAFFSEFEKKSELHFLLFLLCFDQHYQEYATVVRFSKRKLINLKCYHYFLFFFFFLFVLFFGLSILVV